MTYHCTRSQGCTPSGSILKNLNFPQYFPMLTEWSKTDFNNFWMVYDPDYLAHSLSSHDQSLFQIPGLYTSESILKNFYFPQYCPMHSEWSRTDFKQNSTCEWCTTLIFWTIDYLHMTNHCPKSQCCTQFWKYFKKFLFSTILPYALRMI